MSAGEKQISLLSGFSSGLLRVQYWGLESPQRAGSSRLLVADGSSFGSGSSFLRRASLCRRDFSVLRICITRRTRLGSPNESTDRSAEVFRDAESSFANRDSASLSPLDKMIETDTVRVMESRNEGAQSYVFVPIWGRTVWW